VIVEPALGVAEAVKLTAVPTVAAELLVGAVIVTAVEATAVTVTAADVTELFAESTTRAVREKFPAAVGTQVTL
jgi:hypothetical protein